MTTFSKTDVADRAGVDEDFVDRVVSVGLIKPDAAGRFVAADARRTQLAHSLEDESGIALSDLSDAVKDGLISFEFMDAGPVRAVGVGRLRDVRGGIGTDRAAPPSADGAA